MPLSEPSHPHVIEVIGECPLQGAFSAEFERVLPPASERGPASQPGARIRAVDRGASYVVTVGDRVRTYSDPKRDCDERARVGAVFAALTLYPPHPSPEQEHTEPPPTPIAAERVVAPPLATPRSVRVEMALGARVDTALDAKTPASLGAEVRTAIMSGSLGATLGFAFHGATTVPLAGAGVDEQRLSLDLSLRYSPSLHPLWIAVDIGPAPTLRRFLGVNLPVVLRQTRFDVAARFSTLVGLDLPTSGVLPLSVFLGGSVEYEPTPYTLTVAPDGAVGRAPRAWIGGTFGVSGAFE